MEPLTDLKAILHSKRANMYYLEHCRVMQKDGRVLYLTEAKKDNLYFNIPIANTTVILLGTGTSITQAAVRMLAQAGVLIGFCGGGGTPLFMGNDIEWLTPQSEYRPTEYLQGWLSFWFNDEKRLEAAKELQHARINYLKQVWRKDGELRLAGFDASDPAIADALDACDAQIATATKVSYLLSIEARLTKQLYKIAARHTNMADFVRERMDEIIHTLYEYGCYFTMHVDTNDIVFSIFSKIYFAGLNYFSLKETIKDLREAIDAHQEIFELPIENEKESDRGD